jgi:hypothetical protein
LRCHGELVISGITAWPYCFEHIADHHLSFNVQRVSEDGLEVSLNRDPAPTLYFGLDKRAEGLNQAISKFGSSSRKEDCFEMVVVNDQLMCCKV